MQVDFGDGNRLESLSLRAQTILSRFKQMNEYAPLKAALRVVNGGRLYVGELHLNARHSGA